MEATQIFQKPTSSPTPIKAAVKKAMVDFILDPGRVLPLDLGLVVEILYRESIGAPVEHLYKPSPAVWNVLSAEAATWAGLARRDPYLDVLKYPQSKNMSEIRHTFSTIPHHFNVFSTRQITTNFRKQLADVVQAMPKV